MLRYIELPGADGQAQLSVLPSISAAHLAYYFSTGSARKYVRDVLGGVILPGGTLGDLVNWHPQHHSNVTLHIAKTGTSLKDLATTRDRYAVGGLIWKGRPFTYFVLLGSSPEEPLGRKIPGKALVALIEAALSELH